MDDLALPFEQFDHYGRLTALEQILDPAATEVNVDKKGKPLGKVFRGVPVVTTGLIAASGDPKLDGPVKDARELITRIAGSERARQVFKLASIPEGNGTMLDNTAILFLSDSGDGHHPNLRCWPMVVLGNLGGRLKTGGRYLELPGYGQPKHQTIGSLYNTLLHAAGKPRAKFGLDDVGLKDIKQGMPLPELLT